MTDARKSILDKLAAHKGPAFAWPENILPALDLAESCLADRLKLNLEAVHASVDIVSSAGQLGDSIHHFLEIHASEMAVGALPSVDVGTLSLDERVRFYRCEDLANCQTLLTHAPYAVAETGTVILPSSLQRPTLANFLPDNCIVLLEEADIMAHLEDGFAKVKTSGAGMPRALNLISGPSKTADIEQTLVYGAHGPIQLHVIIRRA